MGGNHFFFNCLYRFNITVATCLLWILGGEFVASAALNNSASTLAAIPSFMASTNTTIYHQQLINNLQSKCSDGNLALNQGVDTVKDFFRGIGCAPVFSLNAPCDPLSPAENICSISDKVSFGLAVCAAKCQMQKANLAQQVMQCLKDETQKLFSELGSLLPNYNAAIKKEQNDMQILKTAIADDESMKNDAQLKNTKFMQEKNALTAAINEVPRAKLALQTDLNQINQAIKSYDSAKTIVRMGKVKQCLMTMKHPGEKCSATGADQDAISYAECRYDQSLKTSPSGTSGGVIIESNSAKIAAADAQSKSLRLVIDNMLQDMPSKTDVPPPSSGSNNPLTDLGNDNKKILSLSDFMSLYYGQLDNYRIGNVSMGQFIYSALLDCASREDREISNSEKDANSSFGQMQQAILSYHQKFHADVTVTLNTLRNSYNEAAKIIDPNATMNLQACENGATEQQQANCVDNAAKTMMALERDAPISVSLRNTHGGAMVVSCKGIEGCAQATQNVVETINQHESQVKQQQSNYVLGVNQKLNDDLINIGASFITVSMMVADRLRAVNAALASMGLAGVDVSPMPSRQIPKDSDGLPMPLGSGTELAQILDSKVNPPLPDPSKINPPSIQNIVAQANRVIDEAMSCSKKEAEKTYEKLSQQLDGLDLASCYGTELCKERGSQNLNSAMKVVNKLDLAYGSQLANSDVNMTMLNNGIANACEEPEPRPFKPDLPPVPDRAMIETEFRKLHPELIGTANYAQEFKQFYDLHTQDYYTSKQSAMSDFEHAKKTYDENERKRRSSRSKCNAAHSALLRAEMKANEAGSTNIIFGGPNRNIGIGAY